MKQVPLININVERILNTELKLDSLFKALENENYISLLHEANSIFKENLLKVNLDDSKIVLSIFSNGKILESITL